MYFFPSIKGGDNDKSLENIYHLETRFKFCERRAVINTKTDLAAIQLLHPNKESGLQKRHLISALAISLSLSLPFSGKAEAADFNFTNIADNTGTFSSFDQAPAINDSGTVAWKAFLDSGNQGIFTGSGDPTTTIADSSGAFRDFGFPTINETGTVAFQATLNAGGQGVFTGSGGSTTTIADSSGAFNLFGFAPIINNSGTVAFQATLDAGGQGIFTNAGGVTSTIADSSGAFNSFAPAPDINNSGTVAFLTRLDTLDFGIFTNAGGTINPIADSSGDFLQFGFPDINDSGTVAFLALLDSGVEGIFTGLDPVADKVIATGDSLFGSTVTDLDFFKQMLEFS